MGKDIISLISRIVPQGGQLPHLTLTISYTTAQRSSLSEEIQSHNKQREKQKDYILVTVVTLTLILHFLSKTCAVAKWLKVVAFEAMTHGNRKVWGLTLAGEQNWVFIRE